jgi:penicillin-binding protein 2
MIDLGNYIGDNFLVLVDRVTLGLSYILEKTSLADKGFAKDVYDIQGEAKGLIPTPEWKKQVTQEQWYPGNTVNMSIGQGDVLVTPLQINTMTSAIANEGTVFAPALVTRIADGSNKTLCVKNMGTGVWSGEK